MLRLAGKITAGGSAALIGAGAYKAWTLRVPVQPNDEAAFAAIGTKFVRLPDGRKLEYLVTGALDGVPVYYQGGYLTSCLVAEPLKTIAKDMGLKIISVSMPGFGLSDSYPLGRTRKLSEWPADVAAVLDQENVQKCHMHGASAGCQHVAAVARGLPKERVGNVVVCCALVPDCVPGSTDGVSPLVRSFKSLMGKPYIGDLIAWQTRKMPIIDMVSMAPDCKAAIERGQKEHPAMTEGFLKTCEHALKVSYRGIVDNYGTIAEPLDWLPELGDLVAKGHSIGIMSAQDDVTNPPTMQKWWQQTVTGSVFMDVEPGWGHLHLLSPDINRRVYHFLLTGKDSFKR